MAEMSLFCLSRDLLRNYCGQEYLLLAIFVLVLLLLLVIETLPIEFGRLDY
jgi:hypothetical protein